MIDVVCPVAFGHALTDGTFDRWLRYFRMHNPTQRVVLITDQAHRMEHRRCGATTGMPALSKAGYMKAWATAQFYGKTVLTCDCDLIFTASVDKIPVSGPVMLAWDAGMRRWSWWGTGEKNPEHNSGVIVCQSPHFFPAYQKLWGMRHGLHTFDTVGNRTPEPPWIDEVVATAAWRELNGDLLPREWNWSHWWLNSDATTQTVKGAIHYHGQDGKAKMREAFP